MSIDPIPSVPPPLPPSERAPPSGANTSAPPAAEPASRAPGVDTVTLRHRAEASAKDQVRQAAAVELRDADVAVETAEVTRDQIRFDAQLGLRAQGVAHASASELLLG